MKTRSCVVSVGTALASLACGGGFGTFGRVGSVCPGLDVAHDLAQRLPVALPNFCRRYHLAQRGQPPLLVAQEAAATVFCPVRRRGRVASLALRARY